ncbi:MAG: acyl carrier protein [Lachnospiraceae bacterium]|nr:acyl carrier protein [Lachnospiraceae bacterium]
MFEKIRNILSDELYIDKEKITMDTDFREDLGADSLDLFEMVMALEDEYDVQLDTEQLEQIRTVKDLIDVLEKLGIS